MMDTDLPAEEAETPVEETETPVEAPMEDIPQEDETPPAAAAEPEPKNEPFWYRQTLREKERALKAKERELEELRSRVATPPAEIPDPQYDPQGYRDHIRAEVQQAQQATILRTSEMIARQKHGAALDEAKEWIASREDVAQWAIAQPHPYEALMTAYNREKIAAEMGDDPNAWREKERERIRQELLAETQPQALTPRPTLPGPGSQARSAKPGGWNGPQPVAGILKNNF